MGSPTWVELVGRNIAAAAQPLSGTMRVTGRDRRGDAIDEEFEFWHGGAGRWRITRDGTVVYVASAPDDVVMLIDGEMRRQRVGRIRMSWFGSAMSPLDLLGEDSLIRRMSTGMRARQQPSPAEIDGRSAWVVTLAPPDDDREITIIFDDATGIITGVRVPGGGLVAEVSDLVADTDGDATTFEWTGPVVDEEETSSQHVDARSPAVRMSVLTALSAAAHRPVDVATAVAASADDVAARTAVMDLLGVDEIGADAVLAMQVRRFTGTQLDDLDRELAELRRAHP